MGFFKSLFGGKQADTPSEIIGDIKQIQINDFNRLIKILEIADEESFASARDTLGKFQNAFTTKFKTTKNFRSSPNDVRREYMSTLSSVLTRMNDMNMESQAKDALLRTAQAADIAGIRALLVHAKDEPARLWYLHWEFEPSPSDPFHLFLLMKDIKAMVG